MFFKKPPPANTGFGHPSQDGTCRFSNDQRLRKCGFVIHSRPRKGPTLWSLGGTVYKEQEALELATDIEDMERK